ncbi:MAG: ribonuclease HI family protein [Gemmatales bacterium]|nr:ribonuclease HI family protein [Gemmatales bacterium]MCS7159107.1 ribonuclease HI family protein [Gemmatales bacterium]MDW8174307.1 ribonuclease HI family protein [Gemmatales bacterium]MDW8224259.1 ribonuclease HI family protein [Gemmatales bacterium]
MTLTIHIDGAARGNPGPAAFGAVYTRDGQVVLEEKQYVGKTTNNVAEYLALLHALGRALELGAHHVHVFSDSELLVRQLMGIYQVRDPKLQQLYEQAQELIRQFHEFRISHVPRKQNRHADKLCNQALDEAERLGLTGPDPR